MLAGVNTLTYLGISFLGCLTTEVKRDGLCLIIFDFMSFMNSTKKEIYTEILSGKLEDSSITSICSFFFSFGDFFINCHPFVFLYPIISSNKHPSS
ncbi:hypothetical protein L6452_37081 [Arctium lappa]|uniref:Uncharacterized protein n=1 Tax=Arctium lappa TaxID=4217 RepID=A0ACB8Y1Z1_ARCLA|nr:hypothetical protein L6452_37081 [Arctium lappa]